MPILAVVGIQTSGEREVLAFRVGDRKGQQVWEDLVMYNVEKAAFVSVYVSDR